MKIENDKNLYLLLQNNWPNVKQSDICLKSQFVHTSYMFLFQKHLSADLPLKKNLSSIK